MMGEIQHNEMFRAKQGFYCLFSAKFSENEEQQKGEKQKRVGLAEKGALVRTAKGISTHKEKPSALHEEQWERCLEDISEICRGAPPITVSDAEIQINFPGQSKLKRII